MVYYNKYMPRRQKPQHHTRFVFNNNDADKRRYPSQLAAERAADIIMLQNPGTEISVYQGVDRGWYLTSKPKD